MVDSDLNFPRSRLLNTNNSQYKHKKLEKLSFVDCTLSQTSQNALEPLIGSCVTITTKLKPENKVVAFIHRMRREGFPVGYLIGGMKKAISTRSNTPHFEVRYP